MEVKTKYIFLIIYHSITNGYLILSNAFSAFIVMVILVGVIFSLFVTHFPCNFMTFCSLRDYIFSWSNV